MSPKTKIFNAQQLEEIARAISEIRSQGGYGELVIQFHRGQPRFVRYSISRQFNLRKPAPDVRDDDGHD